MSVAIKHGQEALHGPTVTHRRQEPVDAMDAAVHAALMID